MYFYDHERIERSSDLPGNKDGVVPIVLNDKQWPEGLRFALGRMRKGERSKVKIHKSYHWQTQLDVELLRVPEGCQGERLEKLKTKGIIYDVTLHGWDNRHDIDQDAKVVKFILERSKGNYKNPNGIDEVRVDFSLWQDDPESPIVRHSNITTLMNHPDFTPAVVKVLETMRVGELAVAEIAPSYLEEEKESIE